MNQAQPWSYFLRWTDVPPEGLDIVLTPPEPALVQIADHVGVEALTRLVATISLRRWLDGAALSGRLEATATRECGVSLDLFEEQVDEPLAWRVTPFGSPGAPPVSGGEITIDLEAEDPPDVVEGDGFDLGAYVVELLALSLSPFPRKPDAVFQPPSDDRTSSPFAALAQLRPRGPTDPADG